MVVRRLLDTEAPSPATAKAAGASAATSFAAPSSLSAIFVALGK
jgi:hypothetical protein